MRNLIFISLIVLCVGTKEMVESSQIIGNDKDGDCYYEQWLDSYHNVTCKDVIFYSASCTTKGNILSIYSKGQGESEYSFVESCIGKCGYSKTTKTPTSYILSVSDKSKVFMFGYVKIMSSESSGYELPGDNDIIVIIFCSILGIVSLLMLLFVIAIILKGVVLCFVTRYRNGDYRLFI